MLLFVRLPLALLLLLFVRLPLALLLMNLLLFCVQLKPLTNKRSWSRLIVTFADRRNPIKKVKGQHMPYYAVAKTRDGNGVGIYRDWKFAKPYCIDATGNIY